MIAEEFGGRIDKAILALKDEIAAINFESERGHNRLLALTVAKLDEAAGLAIQAQGQQGRLVVVDRAHFAKQFMPELQNENDRTDRTVTENV